MAETAQIAQPRSDDILPYTLDDFADYQEDDQPDQKKYKEKDLCNSHGRAGQPGETKHPGDQSNNEKNQ